MMKEMKSLVVLTACGMALSGCGGEASETVVTEKPIETAAAVTEEPVMTASTVPEPEVTADPNIDMSVSFGLDRPYQENAGDVLMKVDVEKYGQYDLMVLTDFPMFCMYEEDGSASYTEFAWIDPSGAEYNRIFEADMSEDGKKLYTCGLVEHGGVYSYAYYEDENGKVYRVCAPTEEGMGLYLETDDGSYEYDENGRIVKLTVPDGYKIRGAEHSYEYYPDGKMFREIIRQEGEVVLVKVYEYGTVEEANALFQSEVLDTGIDHQEGNTIKERFFDSMYFYKNLYDLPDTVYATEVLASAMKVRQEPSLSAGTLTTVSEGEVIVSTEDPVESDGYTWMSVDMYHGWMATKEGEYTHTFSLSKGTAAEIYR